MKLQKTTITGGYNVIDIGRDGQPYKWGYLEYMKGMGWKCTHGLFASPYYKKREDAIRHCEAASILHGKRY